MLLEQRQDRRRKENGMERRELIQTKKLINDDLKRDKDVVRKTFQI
jgi:hypothetical protein